MSRDITAAAITASEAGKDYTMHILADLDFPNGIQYVKTGTGTTDWEGRLYKGVGDLGRIASPRENVELSDYRLDLALTGVVGANVSTVLDENIRGRRASLFLAFVDSADALVIDPVPVFEGRMDTAFIILGPEKSVGIRIESILGDWNRARMLRYTQEQQDSRFPGDLFFEFVPQLMNKEIEWGR